jgi:hypothetical protein
MGLLAMGRRWLKIRVQMPKVDLAHRGATLRTNNSISASGQTLQLCQGRTPVEIRASNWFDVLIAETVGVRLKKMLFEHASGPRG